MGMNPTAILYYGVLFEDGYEFPWGTTSEAEDWWLETVHGYPADLGYKEQKEALHDHPLPVQLEFCGIDGCESVIVAAWVQTEEWGGAAVNMPTITQEQKDALDKFLADYCQPQGEYGEYANYPDHPPGLRLASRYW